jgi:hypothetical protein
VKLNPKGRIEQGLGRRLEGWGYMTHGIERAVPAPSAFYQPTDTVVGPDGSTYITDGYGFDSIHAIVCPDEKTVYLVQEFSYRFDKVVLN